MSHVVAAVTRMWTGFLVMSEQRDLNRAAVRSTVSNQPSGLLLSLRVRESRNVSCGRSCNTHVYWIFCYVGAAGFEQGGGAKHRKQSARWAVA